MIFLKNFKRAYNLFEKNEKIKFIILSILTIFVTVFELISLGSIPIYISLIFDPNLINKYLIYFNLNEFIDLPKSENFIYYSSIFVVVVFFLKNIFIGLFYFFNIKFLNDLNVRVGNQIYHNNIYSDYLYHINRSPAELMRNHGEIRRFAGLTGHYQRLFLEVSLLFFLLIVTLKVFFEITILFFGLFTIFFLVYFTTIKKWVNEAGRKIQVYKKIEYSLLDNTFSGIKEIKFNLKESFFTRLFNNNYFKMNRVILLQDMINKIPKISLEMLAVTSIIFISILFYTNEISNVSKISNLSFLSVVAIRLIPAFNGISVATTAIKYSEPAIDIVEKDLKNVTYYSSKIRNNEKIEHYNKKIKSISIKNLTFNYGSEKEILFDNVNLDINENDKIGIYGKSGSGKTSLINLMTGLIPPIKGKVLFNDINIYNKTNTFYNKISYITQDTILFDDTIKNNITFNSDAVDDAKINKIIEICKLNDLINSITLGLQAKIGEKGLKISGGQKQRIGIARALYKNFDLLILDEATSALNKDYENEILNSIYKHFKDRIIIIVSHNTTNFMNCNKLIKIENNNLTINIKKT